VLVPTVDADGTVVSNTRESKSRTVTSPMPSVVRPPDRAMIRWAGTE